MHALYCTVVNIKYRTLDEFINDGSLYIHCLCAYAVGTSG